MRYLLDTHTFLWFIEDSKELGKQASKILQDGSKEIFWSTASYWELTIKISLKKLKLKDGWQNFLKEEKKINRILDLPIFEKHCDPIPKLPWHHKDPFDRLLISQALTENLIIITKDKNIRKYKVKTIW